MLITYLSDGDGLLRRTGAAQEGAGDVVGESRCGKHTGPGDQRPSSLTQPCVYPSQTVGKFPSLASVSQLLSL